MAQDLTKLDAHEQPSERMRAIWKGISKSDQAELLKSHEIDDPRSSECLARFRQAGSISASSISAAYAHVTDPSTSPERAEAEDAPIYYHPMLPGTPSPRRSHASPT